MIPRIFIFLVVWKFSVASDPAHPQSYIDAGIDLEKCNWSESMCVLFHSFPIPSQEHIFTTKCRVRRNQISGRIRVDACSPESRRGNFYQEQCLDKGKISQKSVYTFKSDAGLLYVLLSVYVHYIGILGSHLPLTTYLYNKKVQVRLQQSIIS